MKNKKSKKANLESKRGVLFMFGLVISLAMVLLAFEWKTTPKTVMIFDNPSFIPEESISIPQTKSEKPELPKPRVEISFIEIVGDDKMILEEPDFNFTELEDPYKEIIPLINSYAENKEDKEEKIFIRVEQMPEFPGGELALRKYLANAVKYPKIALENGIMGKVYISFVINEKGGIENIELLRGVDPSLNMEALRVVGSLPHWRPGKQGGKTVKVRYNVPIVFELR